MPEPAYTRDELIRAVRRHAEANYETSGWDVVVEAWDDAAIVEAMGRARTPTGAIRKVGQAVGTYAAVRADVIAAGGGPDPDDGFDELRGRAPVAPPAPRPAYTPRVPADDVDQVGF